MGNVFEDITADGNVWDDDKMQLPITSDTLEWSGPKLWVQCSDEDTDVFAESQSPDSALHGSFPKDTSSRHGERDPRSPSVLVFKQLVFQAGTSVGGQRHPRRYLPLSVCADLESRVLLTNKMIDDLWWYLPVFAQISRSWKLVYCPTVHGVSLRTFYRQCDANPGPTLVVMKDTEGAVFGGFTSHSWQAMDLAHIGQSECFVFTYGLPEARSWRIELSSSASEKLGVTISSTSKVLGVSTEGQLAAWNRAHPSRAVFVGDQILEVNGEGDASRMRQELGRYQTLDVLVMREANGAVQVHTWAGENRYFMHADMDGFAMGGGGGRAFCVDKDLFRGNSAACATFGTRAPLAASEEFVLRHLEVWTFDDFLSEDLGMRHRADVAGQSHQDEVKRLRLREEAADALRFQGFHC